MKNGITKRQLIIYISFAVVTFSNAKFFIEKGWDDPVAYLGYLLLLYGIVWNYQELPTAYKYYINKNLVITLFFWGIGIFCQSMATGLKIRLFLTMLVIAMSALASDGLMRSFEDIRVGAYGLLTGELLAFLLALLTGTKVFSNVEEKLGLFNVGFNAGMSHKNYFAMILMASFSGIYMYRKYIKKRLLDEILLFVEGFLICFSHSRAVWLLTMIFLIIMSTDQIKIYIKQNKLVKIFLSLVLMVIVIFAMQWAFPNILMRSKTYLSRFAGFTSYWFIYCKNDIFHRFFGNAATFFGTDNYYENFRKLINYGGAVDMAILNILIKNGIIGLVGYILIFGRIIKRAVQIKSGKLRQCCLAIIIPMIISMFSENCVSTISLSYAPFCYVVLASLYKQMHFQYTMERVGLHKLIQYFAVSFE